MPSYTFEHKETGEQIHVLAKFEELDQIKAELGSDWLQRWKLNMSSSGGKDIISRTDEGWKDTLKSIKKANPGSTINI